MKAWRSFLRYASCVGVVFLCGFVIGINLAGLGHGVHYAVSVWKVVCAAVLALFFLLVGWVVRVPRSEGDSGA